MPQQEISVKVKAHDLEDVKRCMAFLTRFTDLIKGPGSADHRVDIMRNELNRYNQGRWPSGHPKGE